MHWANLAVVLPLNSLHSVLALAQVTEPDASSWTVTATSSGPSVTVPRFTAWKDIITAIPIDLNTPSGSVLYEDLPNTGYVIRVVGLPYEQFLAADPLSDSRLSASDYDNASLFRFSPEGYLSWENSYVVAGDSPFLSTMFLVDTGVPLSPDFAPVTFTLHQDSSISARNEAPQGQAGSMLQICDYTSLGLEKNYISIGKDLFRGDSPTICSAVTLRALPYGLVDAPEIDTEILDTATTSAAISFSNIASESFTPKRITKTLNTLPTLHIVDAGPSVIYTDDVFSKPDIATLGASSSSSDCLNNISLTTLTPTGTGLVIRLSTGVLRIDPSSATPSVQADSKSFTNLYSDPTPTREIFGFFRPYWSNDSAMSLIASSVSMIASSPSGNPTNKTLLNNGKWILPSTANYSNPTRIPPSRGFTTFIRPTRTAVLPGIQSILSASGWNGTLLFPNRTTLATPLVTSIRSLTDVTSSPAQALSTGIPTSFNLQTEFYLQIEGPTDIKYAGVDPILGPNSPIASVDQDRASTFNLSADGCITHENGAFSIGDGTDVVFYIRLSQMFGLTVPDTSPAIRFEISGDGLISVGSSMDHTQTLSTCRYVDGLIPYLVLGDPTTLDDLVCDLVSLRMVPSGLMDEPASNDSSTDLGIDTSSTSLTAPENTWSHLGSMSSTTSHTQHISSGWAGISKSTSAVTRSVRPQTWTSKSSASTQDDILTFTSRTRSSVSTQPNNPSPTPAPTLRPEDGIGAFIISIRGLRESQYIAASDFLRAASKSRAAVFELTESGQLTTANKVAAIASYDLSFIQMYRLMEIVDPVDPITWKVEKDGSLVPWRRGDDVVLQVPNTHDAIQGQQILIGKKKAGFKGLSFTIVPVEGDAVGGINYVESW